MTVAEVRDNMGNVFYPRPGLEGPFRFRGGRVLYYDAREGAYYDSLTDLYLGNEEAAIAAVPGRAQQPRIVGGGRSKKRIVWI